MVGWDHRGDNSAAKRLRLKANSYISVLTTKDGCEVLSRDVPKKIGRSRRFWKKVKTGQPFSYPQRNDKYMVIYGKKGGNR
jgi:hypothetical protein